MQKQCLKELLGWEHEYLADMYNIDWIALDEIMAQWHERRKTVRKMSDIVLDTDYLIWD